MLIEFSVLNSFANALEKTIAERKILHICSENGNLSLYSEDKFGNFVVWEGKSNSEEEFSAGIEADRFIAAIKRLYQGSVEITVSESVLILAKDNIKCSFPRVSTRTRYSLPKCAEISGTPCQWLIKHFDNCTNLLNAASKVGKQFPGILVESKGSSVRVGKFCGTILYLSKASTFFSKDCRFVFPDNSAKIAKAFGPDVECILIGNSMAGFSLKSGVKMFFAMVNDSYPAEYDEMLCLNNVITGSGYVFDKEAFSASVDYVSSVVGDSNQWVSFVVEGKSGDSLVWIVQSKAQAGTEVCERILSSDGPVIGAFSLNKKSVLNGLKCFDEKVCLIDLNYSSVALTSEAKDVIVISVKSAV